MTRAAIVVAGGVGERFGTPGGKQLAIVAGRPLVSHALDVLERTPQVDAIVMVTHPDRVAEYRATAVDPYGYAKVDAVVAGGETRQASVAAGVAALADDVEMVAIHDGARPLVTSDVVAATFAALEADAAVSGAVVGHPAADTIHQVDVEGAVFATPDRSAMWVAQTPQTFRVAPLAAALQAATAAGSASTDDAALVSGMGGRVVMIEGPRDNIKVTVAEDLAYVEWVLAQRAKER